MPKPRPRRRAREAKRALYRELVVEAAERVFAESGFDASKMQDVAEEAGLALGTVYKCFSGKAEILRAIHERRGGELLAASEATLGAHVEEAASPLTAFLDYVSAYLAFLLAHPDYLRMHLDEASAWGFGTRFQSHVQSEAWQRGHDTEVRLLEAGIRAGLFVERDPSLLVRTAAAIQQVQLAWWIESGGAMDPGELLARLRVDVARNVCRPSVTAWLEAREPGGDSGSRGAVA